VEGKIIAGPHVRMACRRHLYDLEIGSRRGLHFDADLADANIDFFRTVLVHPEGAKQGQPFILEPFQVFQHGNTYGWWDEKTEERRFRVVYIEEGKGNGKTPRAAGCALEALMLGGHASEIYCAAFSKEQANIAWRDAHKLTLASPVLSKRIDVREHTHTLINRPDYSFLTVLSSEDRGISGQRIKFALIDELHEHRDASILQKIQKGTKSSKDPLIFIITNSGVDRNSVCYHYHEYAIRVLAAGVEGGDPALRDDGFFAYVCALDPEDYREEGQVSMSLLGKNRAAWAKANPGLGTVLKKSYLEAEFRQALNMPSAQNVTLRLNFCVWTESMSVWIPDDTWMAGATSTDLRELLRCERCWAGLDLAKGRDVTALVLVFPPCAGRALYPDKWATLEAYWVPEESIRERSERDRVPYDIWAREGHMFTTPGNVTDYEFIRAEINRLSGIYRIQEIAYDMHFGGELVTALQGDNLTVVPYGQGFISMGTPVAEMEKVAFGRQLVHTGHPVTRWMFSNVALAHDAAGNHKIDKEKSKEKVDGPVAMAMGWGRAVLHLPSDDQCRCPEPDIDPAGLCLICEKWTPEHGVASYL